MVLADFKGHKDSVTCCALSASSKLVASSSEDTTVKVIDVPLNSVVFAGVGNTYLVQTIGGIYSHGPAGPFTIIILCRRYEEESGDFPSLCEGLAHETIGRMYMYI